MNPLECAAVPVDPATLILVWLLVAVGAALQGAAGFGMALIAAPPLMLIAPEFRPALGGRALGTALAALFLAAASPQSFDLAFGLLVLLGVALSLRGLRFRVNAISAATAGLFSGLMGTISSIGGPPMALLYQHEGAARLRATLAGYFVLGVVFSLAALYAVGRFGWAELKLALVLSPAMLAGYFLAGPLQDRLSEKMIRPVVLSLSFVSAFWVIARAL